MIQGLSSVWVSCCTRDMLQKVVDLSLNEFPAVFPLETEAKVYFYVIANKKELLTDNFSFQSSDPDINNRRESLKEMFASRTTVWNAKLSSLNIQLGVPVAFLIQGICNPPDAPSHAWRLPLAVASKDKIGLSPSGHNYLQGGGIRLVGDKNAIQSDLHTRLRVLGIETSLPKLTEA